MYKNKNFKSLNWNFLGAILGIVGIVFALYIELIKVDKSNVIFDILTINEVLTVNEELSKLDILYYGENLKSQKRNLILMTIKIRNVGNLIVKEDDYYSQIPFRLKIKDGNIADFPQIIDASNKFIKENVSVLGC